jgi:hypothetical protein
LRSRIAWLAYLVIHQQRHDNVFDFEVMVSLTFESLCHDQGTSKLTHGRFLCLPQICFRERRVTEQSKRLAARVRRFKEEQPIKDAVSLTCNKLLDDGFRELCSRLESEIRKEIDELNGEEGLADTLICNFSVDPAVVQHKDSPGCALFIKFDAAKRQVMLWCDHPTKFSRFMEIRLNNTRTAWFFVQGEKPDGLSSFKGDIKWLVEDVLNKLFPC